MIDGMWWLVILFTVIAALWLLAKSRGAKTDTGRSGKQSNQLPSNDALQKTAALIEKTFSHYRVTRRSNHLLVTKHALKIAMITMDKKIPVGERLLGDVRVLNYHRVPNVAILKEALSSAS